MMSGSLLGCIMKLKVDQRSGMVRGRVTRAVLDAQFGTW